MLLGRTDEMSAISALLAAADDGNSRTLVIAGEPGIGKSALLQHALESAAGMQVAHTSGYEREQDLVFAGLHSLLIPFLGMRAHLPEPQRDALGAAFGLTSNGPADRFLVGLAALTLLADVAADQPLLCVIDDAQWIDRESIEVLAFVARRLSADRIAMLFAIRDPIVGADPLEGFDRLTLGGLDETDAAALLARSASVRLTPLVTSRILTQTQGNPLALEQLGREISVEQASDASALPAPLPLGQRLEASFVQQVRNLPDDTQTLVLIAAAETSSDPDAVRRAASALGVRPEAFEEASEAGLMTLSPRVAFRHPLVRSAIYGGAAASDRRVVHRALADATDREQDPERRALHLAAASFQPDEEVAAELERCAFRARNRGGYAAEASLLARAADLSPDGLSRSARLLGACHAAVLSGNPLRAESLLDLAAPDLRTAELRATARRIEGRLQPLLGRCALGPAMLLEAAQAFIPLDRDIATDSFLGALDCYFMTFSFVEGTTGAEIAQAALAFLRETPPSAGDEHLLLEAVAKLVGSGYTEAVPALRRVGEALGAAEIADDILVKWPNVGPLVANELFDYDMFSVMSTRVEGMARDRGALEALQTALLSAASLDTKAGRFARANERYSEVLEVTALLGSYVGYYSLLDVELLAWRGDDERARAKTSKLEQQGTAFGIYATVCMALLARAVLELGQGHYREAFDVAHRAWGIGAEGYSCQALPHVIEAGVRCGEIAVAREALAHLEDRALAGGTACSLGYLARSQAVLASDDDAEPLYRSAIERFASTQWTTELARSHLLYGEWLRRKKRRLDARTHLRIAYHLFADMGAQAFAERARIELAGTGEQARKRTVETALVLTPQEAQVARLAADRATSREIAAQLFISSKTVEYHLGKVFRKLGVSSRRDLAAALPSEHVGNGSPA